VCLRQGGETGLQILKVDQGDFTTLWERIRDAFIAISKCLQSGFKGRSACLYEAFGCVSPALYRLCDFPLISKRPGARVGTGGVDARPLLIFIVAGAAPFCRVIQEEFLTIGCRVGATSRADTSSVLLSIVIRLQYCYIIVCLF
jgi:hypothetical protein